MKLIGIRRPYAAQRKRRLMPMFKIDKTVDDGMSGAVW